MNAMSACDWVALILLGKGSGDLDGAYHLCASISHFEPAIHHIVLVCDGAEVWSQAQLIRTTFGPHVTALQAPPKHPVDQRGKYLGANVLYGLAYAQSRFPDAAVLKLDADSMLIAPFSELVRVFFASKPGCGVCGTLGRTSARDDPTYGYEREKRSPLVTMISSLPSDQWAFIASLPDRDLLAYARNDQVLAQNLRACGTIARPVEEAVRNGYGWLEYCQGGGYAISQPLLKAMRDEGYLLHAPSLFGLSTGEDVLISMYCRSLGFRVMDYSDCGQPFACMWRGLPFAPDELIQRQHAVIHSLKGDERSSREGLQSFFLERRTTASTVL